MEMKTKEIRKVLSFAEITVRIESIGEDYLITVSGGKAHIGSCVLAVPRPSLSDPEEPGCTSSIINVTGHKDELICRKLAESICLRNRRTVVCTGGFHIDNLEEKGIREVLDAIDEIIYEI